MSSPPSLQTLHHHLRRMGGRDPNESNRAATSLELLFDLTFVICFGVAASQYAHALADGHYLAALCGFAFASFAICWAWVNFSWFSSAYDTDDWIFRVMTMTQMIGVIVLAIGLPRMFASLENDDGRVDTSIMVLGYVVMRIALVLQWVRAMKQDPLHRRACLTYAIGITVAQAGWIGLAFLDLSAIATVASVCFLILVELAVPRLAEQKDGGTPWNAHHIGERHSLFAIIALGEGVVGTVALLSAAVEAHGWTADASLACISGIGLAFGMWWIYQILPSVHVLHEHRERAFIWSYCQMGIVACILATGAGLHVAAYLLQHKASIGIPAALLATAIPVSGFVGLVYALYGYLVRRPDPLHTWLLVFTASIIAAAIIASHAGAGIAVCLFILALAPLVTVVGFEWKGHRHQAEALGP